MMKHNGSCGSWGFGESLSSARVGSRHFRFHRRQNFSWLATVMALVSVFFEKIPFHPLVNHHHPHEKWLFVELCGGRTQFDPQPYNITWRNRFPNRKPDGVSVASSYIFWHFFCGVAICSTSCGGLTSPDLWMLMILMSPHRGRSQNLSISFQIKLIVFECVSEFHLNCLQDGPQDGPGLYNWLPIRLRSAGLSMLLLCIFSMDAGHCQWHGWRLRNIP